MVSNQVDIRERSKFHEFGNGKLGRLGKIKPAPKKTSEVGPL